jgi:ABC-type multidrug transport system fused ATPase/permease subunit
MSALRAWEGRCCVTHRRYGDLETLLWTHRRPLLAAFALTLVGRVAALGSPLGLKLLVDFAIANRDPSLALLIAAGLALALAAQSLAAYKQSTILNGAANDAVRSARLRMLVHTLKIRLVRYQRCPSGMLVSRILTDPDGLRNLIGSGLSQSLEAAVGIAVAFAALLWLDTRLTLTIAILLVPYGIGIRKLFSTVRRRTHEYWNVHAELNNHLTETLRGMEVVRICAAEHERYATFRARLDAVMREFDKLLTLSARGSLLSTTVVGGATVAWIVLGGTAAARGSSVTAGDLVMYAATVAMLAGPISQLAANSIHFAEAVASLEHAHTLTSLEVEESADRDASTEAVRGHLTFQDVTFAYEDAMADAVQGVSFEVPAGSVVALVGPSGCGKSTLAALTLALHAPKRGRVLLDGRDIRSWPLQSYRRLFGVVLQDDFIFEGSLRENITMGCPTATPSDVIDALWASDCSELLTRLSGGLDAPMGEHGGRLSGGERQRVALARALVRQPRLLVLDEATGHLDPTSEARILARLRSTGPSRTTLLITHRPAAALQADSVVVLDKGRVVASGSQQQVLHSSEFYRTFCADAPEPSAHAGSSIPAR